ncbi:hypothetical protein [Roseomonas sp. BN140053]|uniref:hypothetical protein n=1 Tax=Roseomonas sp. BN140053 TaxID=3391898 RepID=UPI0039E961EA
MADVKISDLPEAATAGDADLLPIVQGGITKRSLVAKLRAGLALQTDLAGALASIATLTSAQSGLAARLAAAETAIASMQDGGGTAPQPSGWQLIASRTGTQVTTPVAVTNWMPTGAVGMAILINETITGTVQNVSEQVRVHFEQTDGGRLNVWANNNGNGHDLIGFVSTGHDNYQDGVGPDYVVGQTRRIAIFVSATQAYFGPQFFNPSDEFGYETRNLVSPVTLTLGHPSYNATIEVRTAPLYVMPTKQQRLAVYAQGTAGYAPPGPEAVDTTPNPPVVNGDFSTLAVNYDILAPYVQTARHPTGTTDPTASVLPLGVTAGTGGLTNKLNAVFTPGGTMDTRAKLEARTEFLGIFGDLSGPFADGRDGNYGNYRARYREFPENDPRNLHVFTSQGLKLKARGTGKNWANVGDGGELEAACVRFLTKFTKGSIIELRARFPVAAGNWPAGWFVPGEQEPVSNPTDYPTVRYQDGYNAGAAGKPFFEVDIFDNFGWDGEDSRFRYWFMTPGYAPSGQPNYHQMAEPYATSSGIATKDTTGKGGFILNYDNSAAMHTYSVEWRTDDLLILRIDGVVVCVKKYVTEPIVNSHLILSNEAGPKFNPQIIANLVNNGGIEDGWSYTYEHARIWSGKSNIVLSGAPYNISGAA